MNCEIVDLSCGDLFSKLAAERMRVGLASIGLALECEGLDPSVSAILWPELTVTRNRARWADGFAYGALIAWQPSTIPFVPVSVRPNCCGALLGSVPQLDRDEILSLIGAFRKSTFFRDPAIVLQPNDLCHRNHFLLFGVSDSFPDQTLILAHTCPSILKSPTSLNKGLYPGPGSPLSEITRKVQHDGVQFEYLVGAAASDYLECFRQSELISLRSRIDLVNQLLRQEVTILFNETHQGIGPYYVLLGCSRVDGSGLILGNDNGVSCRLLEGLPRLEQVLKARGETLNVKDAESLTVCPHGLGITAPEEYHFSDATYMLESNLITIRSRHGDYIYSSPENIPFRYRSEELMDCNIQLMQPSQVRTIKAEVTCKI